MGKIVWTFAQGAMLAVCIDETGAPITEAIKELKSGVFSQNYRSLRTALNSKVDEMIFDENSEDGLNQDIVEKPLVQEFKKCFTGYWQQREKSAKKKLQELNRSS